MRGLLLGTWVWTPVIAAVLISAVYLSVVLRVRLKSDAMRLRAAIRELATPGKELPRQSFAFEEFRTCAAELASVAASLRQEEARLSDDASRDPLTGLANRRLFIDTLAREAAFARRTSWPLSLIMVDLDHFKSLNDAYGHKAGDLALRRTADRLSSLVRQSDSVIRYGGEEFAVILPGARLEQATRIAQQLCDGLRCDQFVFEGHTIRVTASFGVAELHECRLIDSEALISHADVALYEAKRNGRDAVVAASPARISAPAAQSPEKPDSGPASTAADGTEEDEDAPIDRDTLALMGSTFSVLQVIPHKHRVGRDTIQQVGAVLQSRTVRLFLLGNQNTQLLPIASVGLPEDAPFSASDGLLEWVTSLHSSSHFVPERYVGPTQITDICGDHNATVVRLPLIAYGEVIGVIEAEDLPSDLRLSKRQQTVLSALSAIGATALKNCDTYERLTTRLCGLIDALCSAVHVNDAYKRNHCRRVSALTMELARAMGQHDEEELQLLRVAGLVHDIGNIELPERLFKKKGRLRDGEWKLLQEHCRIGADIIDGAAEMGRLASIIRHHHEHYDGGGYPDGLAGNEIPIESRIIAVADAYVAMTSPRPHRPEMSHDEATKQIREGAGRQFDPATVDAFLEWTDRSEHTPPPDAPEANAGPSASAEVRA